jgi:signal transduction histidine kinase
MVTPGDAVRAKGGRMLSTADDANLAMKSWHPAETGGMGMGLSTCRSIVDAQGGRLQVSGNVVPGAAFQFTLPLRGEDDPP